MPAAANRQVVLKSRPTGIPQAENFELVEAPRAGAGRRAGAGTQYLRDGRAGDARLGERGGELFRAGADRRRDALARGRPRGRVAPPGLQAGRVRHRHVRLANLRRGRRENDHAQGRRGRPAGLDRPGGPGLQRPHRLFRPARGRPAQAGRNGRRLDRRGRGRLLRRPDREASRAAAASASPAAPRRCGFAARNSATTPRSTTRRAASTRRSPQACPEGRGRLLRQHRRRDQRCGHEAPAPGRARGRSAAPRRSRAGTRRRWARASSATCWSSARACRASSSSTTRRASPKASRR